MELQPIEITTPRLRLRPFRAEDAADVFAYGSHPEVAFFATNAPPLTMEGAQRIVEQALRVPWDERQRFAIALAGPVIGTIELAPDWPNSIANLGYELGREHWGRGLSTEAATAVISYGFEALGLAKIFARADPRNVGSWRVLEKAGMSREGVLRSHLVRRGERVDRVYYGILREEWLRGRL